MTLIPRCVLAASVVAVLLGGVLLAAAPDEGRDPIEGKWLGAAGFPEDRIELGFEFKRSENGELKAYVYQPVLNFYGLELPGVVTRDGATYVHKEHPMTLTLRGDTLEGTYLPLNAPASLRRTDKLPSEVPVPDLPKGPGPKWQAKLGAAIFAPAALRDGIAYVGTTGGILNAVRVSDGGFVWTFVAGRPLHGEALATEEHLYFVCDNGFLFKLDRKTGQEVWRYDLGDGRVSRPLPHQVLDQLGTSEFDSTPRRRSPCWPTEPSTSVRETEASMPSTPPTANVSGDSRTTEQRKRTSPPPGTSRARERTAPTRFSTERE